MSDKFVLNIGCHRNTITSRDSTSMEFDTFDEAKRQYQESRASYKRFGYVVWFAEIVAPDGTKTHLESNPCYG